MFVGARVGVENENCRVDLASKRHVAGMLHVIRLDQLKEIAAQNLQVVDC